MLTSSTSNLKLQLNSVTSDSQTQISQKENEIFELQKQKKSFSQMVDESNQHLHHLKQVNPKHIYIREHQLFSKKTKF